MSNFKDTLAEILAKESAALTEADKAFLRARASYLSAEEKKQYAEIINKKPKQKIEEEAKKKADAEKVKADKEKAAAEKADADKKLADKKKAEDEKIAAERKAAGRNNK
jgi:hypothetical protein